ncbi:uncharacterized protein EI90DRAFT_3055202 [Cantharellus anzutake]|uniref:uncharacterized protein n=1 Tax=Cantharellus anzutake TaxID=1750568 RepID=UPI0019039BA0|nr:uncharacterized protein EI90DRAFT_3055202 [Cantharellus anzutake]KAF8332348.1 hypothetical protein EI90DRAFT_3055202 [Cantharellus anzutake]
MWNTNDEYEAGQLGWRDEPSPSVEVQTSSAAKMQFDQDYFTIDHIKRQLTQLARDLSRIGERRARDEHRLQQLEALDILLSRAKGRAHESDQGQCGFDYRLLMDDDRLEEWLEAGGRHDLYYPEDEDIQGV